MRRIIQNTTAIAATLAMIVPQTGWAELRITDAQAAEQGPARMTEMPDLAAQLQAELDAGLTADQLVCTDAAPRPCADDVVLRTPKGLAVELAEGGAIILAPKADQEMTAAAAPDADALAAALAAAETETAAQAEADAAKAAEDAAAQAEADAAKAAEQAAADAAAQAEADAAKAAEQAEADAAAQAEADAAKAAEQAAADAAAQAEADAAKAAEQAAAQAEADAVKAAEQAAADAAAQAEADAAKAAADAAAQAEADAAKAAEAAAPTPEAPIANALADSAVEPATEQAPAVAGDAPVAPATEAPAAAAAPADTPAVAALSDSVAQPAAQAPAGDDLEAALKAAAETAPEVGTKETTTAQEAAAEEAAPAVAALSDTAAPTAGAPVIEETVTAENTRSSSEDFETNLRDALAQAGQATTQQQQAPATAPAASGGDRDNDLAKALILGLGAVAVGTMLANNRQVALATPDRVIVQAPDGSQQVIKDEVALLRQPGSTVTTENFDDGSSRTIVTRQDGSRVVTIRDVNLRVLRRTLISADGTTTQLIDDTANVEPVDVSALPPAAKPVVMPASGALSENELRAALAAEARIDRRFTLGQVRNIPEVRALVAPVDIAAITFDTGSSAIKPDQAQQLATLGRVIADAVRANPREIFMIEGHTDTVGAETTNLALSDRRAESVALALTEYFQVPPENMVVQGYGEQFLKVRAAGDIRENRRASVRRITDLLQTASN